MGRSSIARRSRYTWFVALALLAAARSAPAADPPARADSPAVGRIEVEAEEIDLGTVSRGDTVEAKFRLRNAGQREVRLLEVHPG